jgi:hypothetical protein
MAGATALRRGLTLLLLSAYSGGVILYSCNFSSSSSLSGAMRCALGKDRSQGSAKVTRSIDLDRWWRRVAEAAPLPAEDIDRISELLSRGVGRVSVTADCEKVASIERSLRQLLRCERFNYQTNRASAIATDYFVSLCVCESFSRPLVTAAAQRMTFDYYDRLTSLAASDCDWQLRHTMGPDEYSRWQPSVQKLLRSVAQETERRVQELGGDILYPAFKQPLSFASETLFLKEMEHDPDFPRYGEPLAMMVTRDEDFARQLSSFGVNFVRRYLFYATVLQLEPVLEPNSPLEHNEYICGARNGFWPVDVRIIPDAMPNRSKVGTAAMSTQGVTR